MPTTVTRPSRGGVARPSRGGPSVAPPAKAGPSVAHVPVSDGVPITFFINSGAILYFTPKIKIEPAQRASMLVTLELHGGGDPLLAASKNALPRISLDDPDSRVRADAWDEDAFGEGLLEHKLLVSDVGRGQWWIAVYNFDGLEASRAHATLTVRFTYGSTEQGERWPADDLWRRRVVVHRARPQSTASQLSCGEPEPPPAAPPISASHAMRVAERKRARMGGSLLLE
jgi:hypothetical protein